MVGWLELHLDDAPLLIVADMNDGAVPETVISDPLLPDRLRAKLGLTDNARRYARDSYALAAILATRPQSIFCAARRSAEGEPLLLSRLLLGGTSQELATTILKYYGADSNENAQNALRKQVSTNAHVTPRPLSPPEKVAPITQVSVTGFSDYLRCPYRFYLKHIEQLLEVHDDFEELDSAGFGSLLHTVLQEFAQGAARESTDPNEIEKALREILVKVALKQFGDPKLNAIQPAARIQIQQLSGRLAPFAKAQARWANEGWRIKYTEYECDPKLAVLPLPGDSTPMSLRGRIDRIDYNERTGNWAVLDYKSGDLAKSPEQLHRRRIRGKEDQAWFNLQLPLYHHILRGAGFTGQIDLGIFRVGSATNDIGISTAEWTVEDLEIAIRCAIEVAESIRAQRFWPPNGDQLDFDEFEALVALANRRLYAGGGR